MKCWQLRFLQTTDTFTFVRVMLSTRLTFRWLKVGSQWPQFKTVLFYSDDCFLKIIVTVILLVSSGALCDYWTISRSLHKFTWGPVRTYTVVNCGFTPARMDFPGNSPIKSLSQTFRLGLYLPALFRARSPLMPFKLWQSGCLPPAWSDSSWPFRGVFVDFLTALLWPFLRWLPVCCWWRLFFFCCFFFFHFAHRRYSELFSKVLN